MRHDVENMVARLNDRLGSDCEISHAPCYGGYRLETKGGSTGFARNTGTEARMTHKDFKLYLLGLHDALDYLEDKS
jgi:hypothetical protein